MVASTAAWIVINGAMGALHYAPGMGEVSVAWEAHIIGFFAGLLLIGPFAAVFGQPELPEGEDVDSSMQSGD